MHDVIQFKKAKKRLHKTRNTYNTVYQFKIILKQLSIPVWRRVHIPENATFHDLHNTIQLIMGWCGKHSYQFFTKNPRTSEEFIIGHDRIPGMISEYKEHINDYLSIRNQYLYYTYDHNSNWEHEIIFESMFPRDFNKQYPLCLKGENSTPPEICNGPKEYNDYLEIINNPQHPDFSRIKSLLGPDFDPHISINEVNFT